jgi:uncharacterized protein YidB (DUF937 family)
MNGGKTMRLLHEVIDDLRHQVGEGAITPLGHVLEELLGGERGSLPDLADRFTQAGLGHIMASWIGNGPNLPIRSEELRRVLGEARVQDMATLAGMPSVTLLNELCRLLPAAVHAMTPEGELVS